MAELMKLFLVASMLVATVVTARTVQMNPGESMLLNGTWVICAPNANQPATPPVGPDDRCDDFYSESSCQKSPIGQVCVGSSNKRGVCVRTSNFAGKPNCACK